MEEQFKEIEGLLESTANPEPDTAQSRIKKYVKLIFPHVALVAVVCLYAVIGAYIFYRLESPNEDWLKQQGKEQIGKMRSRLIGLIKEGYGSKRDWKGSVENELYQFNDNIYKTFKEQYVRYPDVKVAQRYDISDEKEDGERTKRHRSKSREKGEKMWTASSALFFAATTMATIGYGNIVPATPSGRIACVVFALFGAPLAIITIGDLGKFLSECTIWLYKQMKKGSVLIKGRWRRFRLGKGTLEDCEIQSEESSKSSLDWEDLVMDKTEVPVLMVFTILLLYIAFGGILFSFLEGWSYMDAFYYSFISLTTIGFGDIVPENHDYIVLMLIYLGVGLAVTTMCIDLVGIQYIQKIHYFGRKFRGTDLLHLLKRKRMIERRLAMGQGDELLQLYMQQMQQQIPEAVVVEEPWPAPEPLPPVKCTSPTEWLIDDALMSSRLSYTYPLAEKVPSPNVLSIRSFRIPSIYSNSSASARSLMRLRLDARGGSWDESGPSLSEHCSLSTEPSVHIRQAYWDDFRSPDPSLTSFQFDFPLPSPDYTAIAQEARGSRRLNSAPPDPPWPPSTTNSPVGLACMEDWDSYIRMLEEYEKPFENPMVAESSSEDEGPSGFDLDLGAFELVDSGLTAETLLSAEEPVIFHQDMPVHSVHHDTVQTEAALANLMSAPAAMLTAAIPPVMVEDNYCFVVDGERVKMGDILGDDQWWRHTSRPTKYFYSEDLRQFHRVNCITAKGKVIAAKLVSGTIQVQVPSSASTTPRSSVSGTSSRATANNNKVPLCHVYKVIRFYSFWKTCTSFHRIVTMIDKVSNDDRHMNPDFKKRLFVQYLWRNAKAVEKARVQKEFDPRRQRLLRFVTDPNARKRFVEDDSCTFAVIVDDIGLYSVTRGRLQRIPHIDRDESEDSTIDFPVQVNAIPVRKHATEEEVLLHYGHEDEPIPVFSVGEMPLDGPSTLNNIIHCPVKYISKIPPSLVVDNYCFICDGDEVSEEDILRDQQWWKQTSNTTRFYSSDNLTTFHQVTLLQCRGEMRGAYRTKERGQGLSKVPLDQVFRVSRFFSCWRTCHGFHRIVSVISPVTEGGETTNHFKKRIFVQYFWRQERQQDRELVQREYLDQKMKLSPRHSLVPPTTSYRSRAQYPSSSSSMSSFDSTSPRHSTAKEESKWRLLNRVYQSKKAFMSNRPRAMVPSSRDNK